MNRSAQGGKQIVTGDAAGLAVGKQVARATTPSHFSLRIERDANHEGLRITCAYAQP